MATYDPGFKICIYCVGLQCKKTAGKFPMEQKSVSSAISVFAIKLAKLKNATAPKPSVHFPKLKL